jgi:flavin-binding protein dodecin
VGLAGRLALAGFAIFARTRSASQNNDGSLEGGMSTTVAKVIEISSSSSKGIEDAVQAGLKKVSKSVKNISGAWVNDIKVMTSPDGKVTEWRVNMRVSFIVD